MMKILRGVIREEKGQVLVVSALTMLSLMMFWVVVINMGLLVRSKIIVQNAVDNAAQTAATIRARAYNRIGRLQADLSLLFAGSTNRTIRLINPGSTDFLWFEDRRLVAPGTWSPQGGRSRTTYVYSEAKARRMKGRIEEITKVGWDKIDRIKLWGEAGAISSAIEVGRRSGADRVTKIAGPVSLKLARRRSRIRYYGTTAKTVRSWYDTWSYRRVWVPPRTWTDRWGRDRSRRGYWRRERIPGTQVWHKRIRTTRTPGTYLRYWPYWRLYWGAGWIDGTGHPNAESWVYMEYEDVDWFARNTQVFEARKSFETLFGRLVGIGGRRFVTATAASRVYHTSPPSEHEIHVTAWGLLGSVYNRWDRGPMFLEKSYDDSEGVLFFVTHYAGQKWSEAVWDGWKGQLIPLPR